MRAITVEWAELAAWIADMANGGDYARQYILNPANQEFGAAPDAGCGQGRFCGMLGRIGVTTAGIDPTEDLIRHARSNIQTMTTGWGGPKPPSPTDPATWLSAT